MSWKLLSKSRLKGLEAVAQAFQVFLYHNRAQLFRRLVQRQGELLNLELSNIDSARLPLIRVEMGKAGKIAVHMLLLESKSHKKNQKPCCNWLYVEI